MEQMRRERLREIPSVNELIYKPKLVELQATVPSARITETVRDILDRRRQQILTSQDEQLLAKPVHLDSLIEEVYHSLTKDMTFRLRRVINASGIVIHTNCGRSVLPQAVIDFIGCIAGNYSNLELNLANGARGSRYWPVEELLCRLTGAEAAMVVNNNAAAVLLVMRTLAEGGEVIVSRGELVEVGGAFRIPEVLKAGGAKLTEVGTTNKTRLADYAAAITENTAVLLKVHTSNFRVVGFTQSVDSPELVSLGRQKGIPVVEDLGSGTLIDLSKWGLPYEPTVQDAIKAGVDLVTFSGDKLLGGPQAGIIVGKQELISRLKADQLARALRIDKLTLAALEATLRLYLSDKLQEIPTLQMLSLSKENLLQRAGSLAVALRQVVDSRADIEVIPEFSQVGGGALPTADLPTFVVAVQPAEYAVNQLEEFLRLGEPPVLARIQKDKLLLDVRTLLPGDEAMLCQLFRRWVEKRQSD